MSQTMKNSWGAPKYGKDQVTYIKTGKPEKGFNYIRILPPMHSLASSGRWRQFETTHWGFQGVSPKDPSKKVPRPVRCVRIKNNKTKMVTQECAKCVEVESKEAELEALSSRLKAEGKSDDEISAACEPLVMWLKANNTESKHYVNVMYKDGSFGDYKLNHKFHMSRILAIIEGTPENPGILTTDEIDPLALDQGVWFVINRTGDGFGTPDTIDVEYETVEVEVNGQKKKLKQIKLAPLTDDQADKALATCRDLTTLGGQSVSPAQMEALVACGGDPEAIDRILAAKPAAPGTAEAPAAPAPVSTPPQWVQNPAVQDPNVRLGGLERGLPHTAVGGIVPPAMATTQGFVYPTQTAQGVVFPVTTTVAPPPPAAPMTVASPIVREAMTDEEYIAWFKGKKGQQ